MQEPPETIRSRVLVRSEFVPAADCLALIRFSHDANPKWGSVATGSGNDIRWVVDRSFRNARSCHPSGEARSLVVGILNRATAWILSIAGESSVRRGIAWENPQLLVYPTGGYYRAHRDAFPASAKQNPADRRDWSLVVFLDTPEEGGELSFPEISACVSPVAGTIVAFPSKYLHKVEPVGTGLRHTLVTWGSVFEADSQSC